MHVHSFRSQLVDLGARGNGSVSAPFIPRRFAVRGNLLAIAEDLDAARIATYTIYCSVEVAGAAFWGEDIRV